MSDLGLFLILFALLLAAVGVIRFLAWLTDLKEQHGSLPRAGLNAVHRYVVVDTPVMSKAPDLAVLTSSEPVEPESVRADTNAERTSSESIPEPLREPISRRMSQEAVIALLAVQRDENGKYRYSGNDIVKLVGGTRSDVLDIIRECRPETKETPSPPKGHVERPAGGWGKASIS